MKITASLLAAASVSALLAAPAFAQDTVTGVQDLNDRIDDIERETRIDLNRGRDAQRFGPLGVRQGWRGSISASASATDGNTDTGEISLGGRLTYGAGKWTHTFGVAGEYSQDDGDETKENFFAVYEGNRYFTDRFYVFGTGRYEYDRFSTTEHDAFLGFGPGFRIVNTPDFTWRVQAGIGARYTVDQNDNDDTETAGIASSRFYYGLTDRLSLTNDTDVLGSEGDTIATNDFGVNYRLTDSLSTRFSYRTEYNSDPLDGFDHYDNTLRASIVVGF